MYAAIKRQIFVGTCILFYFMCADRFMSADQSSFWQKWIKVHTVRRWRKNGDCSLWCQPCC